MRIIKRKGFNYLIHSFRKDKKTVTHEKYLGKDLPANLEDIKEEFLRKIFEEDYFKKTEKIKKNFRKEWNSFPESVKKEMMIDFSINFTYNTNAIEGSTITLDETEEIIKYKISPHKQLRDVQETINHSQIFFEAIHEKKGLNNSLLLKWHNELFSQSKPDIAGKFRDFLVRIKEYRAPDWQDVPKLMQTFTEWYKKNKEKIHPIELAARLHYKFEKIHPFGDGNGRIGRLIINYILKKNKYPLIIITYKLRKQYYSALSKNENDFVMYFIRTYIKLHKKYLN